MTKGKIFYNNCNNNNNNNNNSFIYVLDNSQIWPITAKHNNFNSILYWIIIINSYAKSNFFIFRIYLNTSKFTYTTQKSISYLTRLVFSSVYRAISLWLSWPQRSCGDIMDTTPLLCALLAVRVKSLYYSNSFH
jgi:hypothetical protein